MPATAVLILWFSSQPLDAMAQALPTGGLWELTIAMEGAPRGGTPQTLRACLATEALAAAPERTLIDAAGRQGQSQGRAPLTCEVRDVQRAGTQSTWQAVCEGPRGPMKGTGSGTLAADAAQLQQAFALKGPLGAMNLKQVVDARRVGAC
jgi:hypothetical protein